MRSRAAKRPVFQAKREQKRAFAVTGKLICNICNLFIVRHLCASRDAKKGPSQGRGVGWTPRYGPGTSLTD